MSAPGAALDRTPAAAEILEGLNPEQRAAVTHGTGPLLIVAGAGTGKTAVLTRRIAWLIATRRARPEQILALTFTEKAAAEMESRVDVLVPYGLVGATITTFHAFCDRLVREHAIELGITSKLHVGTPADMQVFLRDRLFELGLERYLPLGEPDRHLAALLQVFDRARDEDVSPERYQAFAAALAAAAITDAERDRAAAEVEKARAYGHYQRILLESGRVDFGSQISLALRLLRERAHLRREYQEAWRWILVDEFQDTNHVQFELVRLLAAGSGNLTVVGDDDQSIYRFRGAKIENLLAFHDAFPGAATALLSANYRSGQRILDLAHRLIRHNDPARLEAQDPARFDKRLRAARAAGGAGSVEHRAYATLADEAEAVAAAVAERIAAGAAPRSIAVLARTHDQLDGVALALRARGVPFQRSSQRGLYRRPEVMLCLDALRLVADPGDGPAAYGLLGDPLWEVDPVDLARLSAEASRRHAALLLLAARAAADPAAALSGGSRAGLARAAALHQRLCASAARRTTAEVLYEFASESGLLGRLAADEGGEGAERLQNLSRLFRIVQRVGPLLRSDRVPFFIRHLDLLIEAGDDPEAAAPETEADAVPLLTAHNAKGLEFEVVHLVQLAEERFPLRRRGEALPFPPELAGGGDPRVEHEREERRLFYVAMTRARDVLVLSHAAEYGGRRGARPSRFLAEALGSGAAPKRARAATAAAAIARHAPAADPAPASAAPPRGPLELSHAQIDDWHTCPLKYRYAHVVKVPLGSDPAFMFGNAVHHALRVFHQHRMKRHPIDADAVVRVFEEAWSGEGFLSREHEERRLEQGRAALRRFVAREEAAGAVPLAAELEFRFRVGDDAVRGRWDRIDEAADGIVLVDFKTADLEGPEKAAERAARSARDGQLGLYALAYAETRGAPPARVRLHFVDTGEIGEATVAPDHLARARDRIGRAAAGIRAGEFRAKPDVRSCGWCPYARFCPHSATRSAG